MSLIRSRQSDLNRRSGNSNRKRDSTIKYNRRYYERIRYSRSNIPHPISNYRPM